MNELASAFSDFNDNAEENKQLAGVILLQETLDRMDTPIANFGKGMATISASIADYNSQITETSTKQEKQNALMALSMNTLGALAGSFSEGSDAAKIFTLAQQGVAIANAAAAITEAGTKGDTYSAPARVAAMLSLMASVLSAFGVAAGGVSSAGGGAAQDYQNRIGNDRLLDRDLVSNTLVDSIDDLVEIDTQLFSATRDLQLEMKNLVNLFERIGQQIFTATVGGRFGTVGNEFVGEIQGADVTFGDLGATLDTFLSNITFGLADDLIGAIGGFLSSTKVSQTVLDSGIKFGVTLDNASDSLEGFFSTIDEFAEVLRTETTKKLGGLSSSTTTSRFTVTEEIPRELVEPLNRALDDTLTTIDGLINVFTDGLNINLDAIYNALEGRTIGRETLSLQDLGPEETAEAIATYFSALTEDILTLSLPFLERFRSAGESLGDTLIRLTSQTIILANSFRSIGIDISDFYNDIAFNIIESSTDANDSILGILTNSIAGIFDNLLGSIRNPAERLTITVEQFKAEIAAAWETAFFENFKDFDEFTEFFEGFSNALYSETELLQLALENTTVQITEGLASIREQLTTIGRTDLIPLLEDSVGDPEALRTFFTEAFNSGAFKATVETLGGEINTIGADIAATTIILGEATNEFLQLQEALEDLVEDIDNLNRQYIQQIALFGKLGKEAELLTLAFDFEAAIKEAKETGSNISLVEEAFGLERLQIIKDSFEEIKDEIESIMNNISDSILDVARNFDVWDELAFDIIKINKLVTQLSKGTNNIDLSSLVSDTSEFQEFIDNFDYILNTLSEEGPGSISEEIQLVDDLRQAIIDRYNTELNLISEQGEAFKALSIEIQDYLDNLIISDRSPLTNFERLSEAQDQFLNNATNIFSDDQDISTRAAENLLESADALLETAFEFFSIGPEYLKIFNLVTDVLGEIDATLIESLNADPTITAIEDLHQTTIDQLTLLDNILVELESQNQQILADDIAGNITEGMAPLIGDIIDKLQSLDDDTWSIIITQLEILNQSSINTIHAIENLTVGGITTDINTVTGDIDNLSGFNDLLQDSITPSFDIGTLDVPSDTLANLHKGETVIPKPFSDSLREGKITLGIPSGEDNLREGSVTLIPQQDNTEIVEAIRELSQILAVSQEDIADATNKNVEASESIAVSINKLNQNKVETRRVA
jgi:ferritin-like metal-binding protein YciE